MIYVAKTSVVMESFWSTDIKLNINNNVDLFSGCNNAADIIVVLQNFLMKGVNPCPPPHGHCLCPSLNKKFTVQIRPYC